MNNCAPERVAIVPVTTSVVTMPSRKPSEAPLTGGEAGGVEIVRG